MIGGEDERELERCMEGERERARGHSMGAVRGDDPGSVGGTLQTCPARRTRVNLPILDKRT